MLGKQTVAVTGANGFIGSVLCATLHRSGYSVIPIFSRSSKVFRSQRTCDITDPKSVIDSLDGGDIIIHLAGESDATKCSENFERCHRINVEGTKNVLNASKGRRLIFASSSYVYGIHNKGNCSENDPLFGMNPYATTKIAAELLCNNYSRDYRSRITIVRFFTIFGEKMNENHLVPSVIKQALFEKRITIRRMSAVGDFLHVEDATSAIVSLIQHGKNEPIYNIGSGVGSPISEIVNHIIKRLGKMPTQDLNIVGTEPLVLVADITKLKSTGWRQQVPLHQGLDRMIEFYRGLAASGKLSP
jgi:nucleoside-diphosphate-sugar epimerase